jgi:hypothetical protein
LQARARASAEGQAADALQVRTPGSGVVARRAGDVCKAFSRKHANKGGVGMSENIEVEHNGETITYQEWTGKWTARECGVSALQLGELKKKLDAIRKKEWKPITAIHDYGREMRLVTVTSDAESLDYNKVPEFWISVEERNGKKTRRKVPKNLLYADSEHNREIIKRVHALEKEAEALNRKCGEAMKELQPFIAQPTETVQ